MVRISFSSTGRDVKTEGSFRIVRGKEESQTLENISKPVSSPDTHFLYIFDKFW